jgi:N-methylhydantoinase B/oxoprolinase/acetone carboxylase alpha subunit
MEEMMTKRLKSGDRVSWKSHGGTAHGKVVKKLTSSTEMKGHKVAASKENPEYLVETEECKQAAHKAEALTKV